MVIQFSFRGCNYSSAAKCEVKEESGWSKHSYIKFNLNNLTGTITRAGLRLNVQYFGNSIRTVSGVLDDNWSEDSITWINKPFAESFLNSQAVPDGNQWIEFEVTEIVANEANEDNMVTFVIHSPMRMEL